MTKLDDIRIKINTIDHEMAKLFEERMKLAGEVANYKKEHALPIYDETREKALIQNNKQYIKDEKIKEYYIDFLKSTMGISKKYQSFFIFRYFSFVASPPRMCRIALLF